MEQQVRYGLTLDGKLLGYHTESNEGAEFCTATSYVLDRTEDRPWLVETEGAARFVAETSTEWFNAGHDTPTNPYVGRCQVVKVTLTLEAV